MQRLRWPSWPLVRRWPEPNRVALLHQLSRVEARPKVEARCAAARARCLLPFEGPSLEGRGKLAAVRPAPASGDGTAWRVGVSVSAQPRLAFRFRDAVCHRCDRSTSAALE